MGIRYDWHETEIRAVYFTPLLELIYQAASVHRQYHDPKQIQVCKLVSIKTGGCPEDCSYCAQSSRYQTEVKPQALLDKETVVNIAQQAKKVALVAFVWVLLGEKCEIIRSLTRFWIW